jgi:DNA invertase Pin-like site-specific DNA recombinase
MKTIESSGGPRPIKIQTHHLERWAFIYVRQSHPQQVQRHRESAQVQKNLQHRAIAWGWPSERIRVLDGDQGTSATSTAGRDDFSFLISEIALEHVGIVFSFQINRLAREDEACCHLIKLCSVFDTLLADEDGLYHPHDFNDRLVLTVKGLVGGVELHQIQQRMQAGRLNKARRGEWLGQAPLGFVVGPDGKLQFDPDEQAQVVTRLVLEQFRRQGSVSGLLRYLVRQHVDLPIRSHRAETKGQLQWRRPHRDTLRRLIHNPAYAGAYTWGRCRTEPRRVVAGRRGTGRVRVKPADCAVFVRDNHAAYISWEEYQANLRRLTQQRQRGPRPGPARQTVSLLAGLVFCGHCGSRMQTQYSGSLRYECQRQAMDYGTKCCQSLAGQCLEQLASAQVLRAVEPASLTLALQAAAEWERQRAECARQWQLRLERARQETQRADRQYDAVEPENRLVARTLERKWETALAAQRTLEEEYDRFQQARPRSLSAAERAQIESLARDLPGLWESPGTSLEDKRHMMRLLLDRVVVWAAAESADVTVELHWAGGTMTRHSVRRAVRSWKQWGDCAGLRKRVQKWHRAGKKSGEIAAELNAQGHRTPHGALFTAATVRQLLSRGVK